MVLKQSTIQGFIWSFIDNAASLGSTFIIGIFLARMLTPSEYGLIGMITIFIAISETFVNSGFSQALIRKINCTNDDYSTVFYYNLTTSILFYSILVALAPSVAQLFNEPQLKLILQVVGLKVVVSSLSLIHLTIITKNLDFKLLTRITLLSNLISGLIAIYMAYRGFGVWSLVAQQLSNQLFKTAFLWMWNSWKPVLVFRKESFKELFGFGSNLLLSGLIDTMFRNLYVLVIGKFFSAQELGFYTRADNFKNLPSQNINGIVSRVSYPVMSKIQDDIPLLKEKYRILIRSTMFVTFILMLGMAAVAEPMIILLIGEKWRPSIVYLQMLSFVGMMYPLHSLNLNMLQVQGYSGLFLKIEIIKKILAIPTLVIGVFWGVKLMIAGMMINSLISYYLNSYWSGIKIGYSIKDQIKDILPSFALSLFMAVFVFYIGLVLPFNLPGNLIVQVLSGFIFVVFVGEIFKVNDYLYIKSILREKVRELRHSV